MLQPHPDRSSREDVRVDEDNVSHRQEGRQARENFGANRGAVSGKLEVTFQHDVRPPRLKGENSSGKGVVRPCSCSAKGISPIVRALPAHLSYSCRVYFGIAAMPVVEAIP